MNVKNQPDRCDISDKIKIECSVVVPVYNSQETLFPLVERIVSALSGSTGFEIILVNDGSRDQSWNTIKGVAAKYPQVIGIDLRKNSGQDNAIMAGMMQSCGQFIVIMDDDLQHAPEDILRLIQKLTDTDTDVCFAHFEEKKQAWWKNIGSWTNGKFAELVISKPREVYLSPFKAIRADVVREIIRYDGPYPYVDGLLFSVTNRVSEIPALHHERKAGRSNYSLKKSIRVAMRLITSFSVLPLRVASFVGVGMACGGFLLAVFYICQCLIEGRKVEGWLTLVLLTILLNGVMLLALGAIGEYLGRTYLSINKRPQYSIRSLTRK